MKFSSLLISHTFKKMACEIPCTSFILEKDVIESAKPRKPTPERDYQIAKLTMQVLGESGDNLYEHLIDLIQRILFEKGVDEKVLKYFELMSQDVSFDRFRMEEFVLEPTYIEPERLEVACKNLTIFTKFKPFKISGEEQKSLDLMDVEKPLVYSIMQLKHHWRFIGIGFPYEEIHLLSNAMRSLQSNPDYEKVRFWGKVYTMCGNSYLIMEASLSEGELEKRLADFDTVEAEGISAGLSEEEQTPTNSESALLDKTISDIFLQYPKLPELPPLPKKEVIPTEAPGSGLNKYTYLVCSYPGRKFVELPIVTPEQIIISRQMRKFFTGDLEAPLISNPKFPGVEKNYLRAMIARITASTYISPMGYYTSSTDEEEDVEEEEDLNNDRQLFEDDAYSPLAINDLLLTSNWVHHRPHILNQGRVNWIRLKEPREEEEEEEEQEEEEEGEAPEVGPEILSTIMEDIWDETTHIWSIRLMTTRDPSNTFGVVKSFIWPGAYAFAKGRVVDNIYIGFGMKAVGRNYYPPKLPQIMTQYPIGPEIMEITDPSVIAEEAWRLAHLRNPSLSILEEEGELDDDDDADDNDDDEKDDDEY